MAEEMKGSITKYTVTGSSRPKWRYRLRVGKDDAGNSLREGRGGFAKEGEARDAMDDRIKEIKAQRNAPKETPAPEITLADWLTRWIDMYAVQNCQPKTIERYKQLASYITKTDNAEVATVASTRIAALKHAPLETALLTLMRQPAKRRKHISARTVRHIAGVLQVALNEAFRLDMITVNPMLKVKLPSVEQTHAESLTPEQVRAVREKCRGDWTFNLVELTLATGARRGEMLALTWANVDWVGKSLTIASSLEQTAAGLRIKSTKSGKSRPCSLPQSAIAALQFQREQQAEHKRHFGVDYVNRDLVFAQANGDYLEPDLVSQVVIRRMRKAGIKKGSFHSLRHTLASILLSRGVPLPAVSARLGHADVNVTARIYAHAIPDDDRRAADTWETVLLDLLGKEAVVSEPVH
jgi:integrase